MSAPTEDLRLRVAARIEDWADSDLSDEAQEESLEGLLAEIEHDMDGMLLPPGSEELSLEEADELLADVDAWAGLISHAVARAYAPASPWPRRRAGWAKKIVQRLRKMANKLKKVLQPVSKALGAVHYSISVSFPWGIGIGVSF